MSFKKTLILAIIFFSGCAAEIPEYAKPIAPLNQLYNQGLDDLLSGNYLRSVENFKTIEQHYPYTIWSKRAVLLTAYAHYNLRDCTRARLKLDYYVNLYPADKNNAYAEYLKGRCYYDDMLVPGRDQGWTNRAKQQFELLINLYPDSVYARDSREKLEIVISRLAGQELLIGRYYQQRKYYASAIKRYKNIFDKYNQTIYIEETLHRLVESNLSLGLVEEARYYGSILGYNYPSGEWYRKTYSLFQEFVPEALFEEIDEPTWELENDLRGDL